MKTHIWAMMALVVVTVIIFATVLLPFKPVVASDSPLTSHFLLRQSISEGNPIYYNPTGYLGQGGGGRLYSPTMLSLLVPVKYVNTFLFSLSVLLVGIGMYFLCVSLSLSPVAAFTGACSIMMSGHFITCVYSGHTGKFLMLAIMILALFCLTYGIIKRNLVVLAWSGIFGGIGVSQALDVGSILSCFFAAWMIFLIIKTHNQKQWFKLIFGLSLAVIAGVLFSMATIVSLLGLSNEATTDVAVKDQRTAFEQWNWATQWSLPKAETLTFIMPGFYGWGHTAESPYWGSIGRDARWPEAGGFPRFSINTQNMGVVVIALALFAIVYAFFGNGQKKQYVYFWAGAAAIALMFAWGRYFDIAPVSANGLGPYRLFYSLPKMDAMRNPLKFLYPFMISISILAAYGMNYLIQIKIPNLTSPKATKKTTKK